MNRRDFFCGIAGIAVGVSLHKMLVNLYKEIHRQVFIPGFGICLTHHCNLNCKSCDQLAPVCEKEFLSFEQFKEDFKKMKMLYKANSFSSVFTGGEPLLNPECEKIFEEMYKIFPKSKTTILTNATLLNGKDDSFWKLLQKYKIKLFITRYPINIDRKIYEEKAEKYGIEIEYKNIASKKLYDFETKKIVDNGYNYAGDNHWGKLQLDLSGSQDYKEKFYTCPGRSCYMYARGNIYFCPVHANLESFSKYFNLEIPVSKDDYIRVSDVKDKKEIDDFISSPNSLCRFCKYCHDICYGKKPQEWEFSQRKLSEWT